VRTALQNARRTAKCGGVNAVRLADKAEARGIAVAKLTEGSLLLFGKRVLLVASSNGEALKFDGFVDTDDLKDHVKY
jgi:hypothetical protein